MSKLGGYLIGYGIKKKDGEFKKVIFDKPIHNTITKHCLNNLLTFDGTNAITTDSKNYCSMFVRSIDYNSASSTRYGVIEYAAIGDGTGTTSTNDSALKNMIGTYTNVKQTGNDWCGTYYDDTNAIVKLRVSHKFTVENDCTVREIGWFNRIYPDGAYTMSARVQLDVPVPLSAGETFYSIYELRVSLQGVEKFSDFGGLGGGYKVNCAIRYSYSGYNSYYRKFFPEIQSNGRALLETGANTKPDISGDCCNIIPPWANVGFRARKLSVNLNKTKAIMTVSSGVSFAQSYTATVKDYVMDSFYRDTEFLLNPAMLTGDCYGFVFDGVLYRFGIYDENNNFTPTTITVPNALKVTVRQSWSTDLLTPTA